MDYFFVMWFDAVLLHMVVISSGGSSGVFVLGMCKCGDGSSGVRVHVMALQACVYYVCVNVRMALQACVYYVCTM